MKPHPRIRKTIKWGSAAVTVLLMVVWIGSGWYTRVRFLSSGWMLAVGAGRLTLSPQSSFRNIPPHQLRMMESPLNASHPFNLLWTLTFQRVGPSWSVACPLWISAFASGLTALTAWRLDVLSRRRHARLNLCPNCGYDRTGLAPVAVCPECGTFSPARRADMK